MTVAEAMLIAVAGFLAGGVNAVAGGGSLISFPALVAIGLPTLDANVTNTTAVWPGYVGSTLAYRGELGGQGRRLRSLLPTTLAGAGTGAAVLLVAPDALFDAVVPVLVAAGSVLLVAQPRVAARVQARASTVDGTEPGVGLQVAAFAAGAYGAYFGGGLGVILLAVLGAFVHDHLQRLNALKTALSLAINTLALLIFAVLGPVDWSAVAVVAPASLLGGWAGGHGARRLSPGGLRWAVAGLGMVVSGWLLLR